STSGNDSTGDGTEVNPFATIARAANYWLYFNGSSSPIDGTTIYVQPGTYQLTSTNFTYPNTAVAWLTITTAPGVDRSQVIIAGHGDSTDKGWGLRTKLMHFKGVTFAPQTGADQSIFRTTAGSNSSLWVDGCA